MYIMYKSLLCYYAYTRANTAPTVILLLSLDATDILNSYQISKSSELTMDKLIDNSLRTYRFLSLLIYILGMHLFCS